MTQTQQERKTWRGGEVEPFRLKEFLRAGGVVLVDVRTEEEVRRWPLAGALHIPLDSLAQSAPRDLPADKPIVTVCSHGRRSAAAAKDLAGQGYWAASLQGGLAAWAATYDAATLSVDGGELTQLRRLGKGCLSYVLEADGEAAVVDPTCHLEAALGELRRRDLNLRHVVDTHRHADHLSGAVELARATGASLHLSEDGFADLGQTTLEEGTEFSLGTRHALVARVVATPGHTPGSVSLLVGEDAALTGDMLFLDGFARPDLRDNAEEQARELYRTYRRVSAWPARMGVFPAHLSARWPLHIGEVATKPLGEVRHELHVFSLPEDAFVQRVVQHLPERPPNYRRIVAANRVGSRCDPDLVEAWETGGNQCVAG